MGLSNAFCLMKYFLYLDLNFTKFYSWNSNEQIVIIGSGNGLLPLCSDLKSISHLLLSDREVGVKNAYEVLTLGALKFSSVYKIYIFQSMGRIFCVEFQRVLLKFHAKYLTHSLKDMIFIECWNFKSCSPLFDFTKLQMGRMCSVCFHFIHFVGSEVLVTDRHSLL